MGVDVVNVALNSFSSNCWSFQAHILISVGNSRLLGFCLGKIRSDGDDVAIAVDVASRGLGVNLFC